MKHILILSKGIIWDKSGPSATKLSHLRRYFSGDVVHSVEKKELISDDWSGFHLCGCYTPIWIFNKLGPLYSIYFFIYVLIRFSYRHYWKQRYECIVARDPIISGPLALLLSKACRTPFIVEMNGNYANPIIWNEGKPNIANRLKYAFVMQLIPFILNRAKGIRILYPTQLTPYNNKFRPTRQVVSCFHEFTQLKSCTATGADEKYILLIGAPAHIKGADILLRSFIKIADLFPDYRLKIVGWYQESDKLALQAIAKQNPRIDILLPVPPTAAQRLIDRCTFFVLPSRSEGMGRVLLESMIHGKAVIGSDIEGIPHYVKNGVNGLLFESENVDALSAAMQQLLQDSELRLRLGLKGKEIAMSHYSEEAYAVAFAELIASVTATPSHNG